MSSKPKPFLKWAGGKTKLLPEILKRVPKGINTYIEPFVGGGAVFFALHNENAFKCAIINDINRKLIDTYDAVKKNVEEVINILERYENTEEFYYRIRSRNPSVLYSVAARMIYLNKTCFNGLYRENKRGDFNVPYGKYKNPNFCDEDLLRSVSKALKNVVILSLKYEEVLKEAKPGDFIYFDPPYYPTTPTSFIAYNRMEFGPNEQGVLAEECKKLNERGVKFLLSNSSLPQTHALYKDFVVEEVFVGRSINRNGKGRGKVPEILVRNY